MLYFIVVWINHFLSILLIVSNLELSPKRQRLLVDFKTRSISRDRDVSESLVIDSDTSYIIDPVIFNQPVSHLPSYKDKSLIFWSSLLSFKSVPSSPKALAIVPSVSNTSTVSTLTLIPTACNTSSVANSIPESFDEPFKPLPIRPVTQSQSKVNYISFQSPGYYMGKGRTSNGVIPSNAIITFFFANSHEPYKSKTYTNAVNTLFSYQKQWQQALQEEIDPLYKIKTWILTDLLPGQKNLDRKWIYKLKRGLDRVIQRYKAWCIVKKFQQQEAIDYNKIFASVVKPRSYNAIFTISTSQDWEIEQIDVRTAFLDGRITENIYVY